MRRKIILTSSLGNIFDAYDANLYAVFAGTLAPIFFPHEDPFVSLMNSLLIFMLSYVARPAGALLFGHLGDRYGRKKALSLSMMGMAVPTLCIGFLPSSAYIGFAAPLILALCRIMQGLCSGGELNGAMIFSAEHFPKNETGRVTGFIAATGVLGVLLAMGVGAVLVSPALPQEAWRMAFIFGGIICIFGAAVRSKLLETPAFTATLTQPLASLSPLKSVMLYHRAPLALTLMKGAVNGSLSYTLMVFMPLFFQQFHGVTVQHSFMYGLVGMLFFMIFAYVGGCLFDKYNQKPLLVRVCRLIALLAIPLFHLYTVSSPPLWVALQAVVGALTGLVAGTGFPFLERIFPVAVRYTGVSLGFTLGVAIFGGTAPLLMLALGKSIPLASAAGFTILMIAVLFLGVEKCVAKKIYIYAK